MTFEGGLVMNHCSKCGAELVDDAVNCERCGYPANIPNTSEHQQQACPRQSGVITAAKVFMIIGTVAMSLYTFLIGLAWCLPMTIHYFNCMKRGENVGIGFKICTMLFVNTIAGILMFCDNSN